MSSVFTLTTVDDENKRAKMRQKSKRRGIPLFEIMVQFSPQDLGSFELPAHRGAVIERKRKRNFLLCERIVERRENSAIEM